MALSSVWHIPRDVWIRFLTSFNYITTMYTRLVSDYSTGHARSLAQSDNDVQFVSEQASPIKKEATLGHKLSTEERVCAPCARADCPCNSVSGDVGDFCGLTCRDGEACHDSWHLEPRKPSTAYLLRKRRSELYGDLSPSPSPAPEKDESVSAEPRPSPGTALAVAALTQTPSVCPWASGWPTKFLTGFKAEANAFYPRKENGWYMPVLVSDIQQGPDDVGMFPTAINSVTRRQLRHGVFASVLKPLSFIDEGLQAQLVAEAADAKAKGLAKPSRKPEAAASRDRIIVRTTVEVAGQRRNQSASNIVSDSLTGDNRAPTARFTMSGVYIPHSGWDDAILDHILNNLRKLFQDTTWTHEDELHFRQQLVERNWASMQSELPDLLLDMALHDHNHKSVVRSKTADRLMRIFTEVHEESGNGCMEVTVRAWMQRLHLQPDTPEDHKLRTHAKNCPARAGQDWCRRKNADAPTLCPAQLKHTTIDNYCSMLKLHHEASSQLVVACESKAVQDTLKELKSAQITAGRFTVGGTLLPLDHYKAMAAYARRQRDHALATDACPTVVFKWDAFIVYLTHVKQFARRGTTISLMEKSRVWLLRSVNMQLVMAVDLVQNKVEACDPTALTFIDETDDISPLSALREMYTNLEAFGVDVSAKASLFVLSKYELRDGLLQLIKPTKSNPTSTWTPAQFDGMIKSVAKAVKVPGWEKASVKSLRLLNVVLGNAAGLSQDELNLRCGWTEGSMASENYVRLARLLGKMKPTVSDEQRQALRDSTYVPFSDLVQRPRQAAAVQAPRRTRALPAGEGFSRTDAQLTRRVMAEVDVVYDGESDDGW